MGRGQNSELSLITEATSEEAKRRCSMARGRPQVLVVTDRGGGSPLLVEITKLCFPDEWVPVDLMAGLYGTSSPPPDAGTSLRFIQTLKGWR